MEGRKERRKKERKKERKKVYSHGRVKYELK
jgi:hypothetical protein